MLKTVFLLQINILMDDFLRTGNYGNVKGSARFASNDGRAELIVGFEGIPCENQI